MHIVDMWDAKILKVPSGSFQSMRETLVKKSLGGDQAHKEVKD